MSDFTLLLAIQLFLYDHFQYTAVAAVKKEEKKNKTNIK